MRYLQVLPLNHKRWWRKTQYTIIWKCLWIKYICLYIWL